jgi:FlaG/FlaF family flagellin (archaellin)
MPFCRNCGAPKPDESAVCERCHNLPVQYYMPPQMPRKEDEAGKIVGIIVLVMVVIVAVTVVLAAVLYVMVIGMSSGPLIVPPAGSWAEVSTQSNTSGRLMYGTFSRSVSPMDVRIYVMMDDMYAGYIVWSGESEPLNWVDGPTGAQASYFDNNPEGNEINAGDYISLNGLGPGTDYSFDVYYTPTDSLVVMSGAEPSFTTDP